VLAPLVLELTLAPGCRPVPYLLAVAMASNVGSTATITGNPQNMMIGSFSHITYTAAERIRNTRDRKPKRAIYSLFATIIILRNSQKPRDRRIFDRLDMTAQSTMATRRWGARHCDARGDGRTGGADRRRRGETVATRANHRGDGAARGRRADHGDRVDHEPAGSASASG
jgi:hypothetical protein